MKIVKLNLNARDIDLNKKSIKIWINDKTFEDGQVPVALTAANVKDINDRKRFITISPSQIKKTGGAIPLLALIPAAAALFGGLAGGASSIATAVHNKKKMDKEIEEQKRHNLEVEKSLAKSGTGFVLKKGKGYVLKKKTI